MRVTAVPKVREYQNISIARFKGTATSFNTINTEAIQRNKYFGQRSRHNVHFILRSI